MTDDPGDLEVPDVHPHPFRRPAGHNFRVGRTRIEHGWRIVGTCTCRFSVNATNYGDLSALINDHYAEVRLRRDDARQEARR